MMLDGAQDSYSCKRSYCGLFARDLSCHELHLQGLYSIV